jgi:preprotein translocase subunit Sec61beta
MKKEFKEYEELQEFEEEEPGGIAVIPELAVTINSQA